MIFVAMSPQWPTTLFGLGMLMTIGFNVALTSPLGSSSSVKAEPPTQDDSDYHRQVTTTAATELEKPAPVKRYISSVVREGKLQPYRGKRPENDLVTQRLEHELNKVKRYLGSVVRQGRRYPHFQALPMPSEQEMEDNLQSEEEEFQEDKRHIGSLAKGSGLVGVKGRRFQSFPHFGEDKRHLASLVRGGARLGNQFAEKRFIGSLARTGDLPYRLKRSLTDEFYPLDQEDSPMDYVDDDDDNGPFMAIGDDDQDSDENFLIEKKHIGSVAKAGYMPYSRFQRRPPPRESSYRRHYKRRPSTSLSGRLRLLNWLQQEEERLKQEQENGAELDQQNPNPVAMHDKRNLAALARNGMLPAGYRISRSASREVTSREKNAPPVMRMIAARHQSVSPRMSGYIKAPHAFQSLYSNPWRRYKRSIGSIARQGMLRNKESTAFSDDECSEGSKCSSAATTPEMDEVDKRHLSSLARVNQLPTGKRIFSDEEEELDEEENSVNETDDDLFPYPEIIF